MGRSTKKKLEQLEARREMETFRGDIPLKTSIRYAKEGGLGMKESERGRSSGRQDSRVSRGLERKSRNLTGI